MEENEANIDEIALKPDKPMKLSLQGGETALVMGKTQVVKKYECVDVGALSIWRVTSQGLVVSGSGRSNPAIGFAMSNY